MTAIDTPDEIYAELFEDVQMRRVCADSKTFADATPRSAPREILRGYREQRRREDFDLEAFVDAHFQLPEIGDRSASGAQRLPIRARIDALWDLLTREADEAERHSSLIALPRPYVVPGGRFREIYYWDSYFTMLGLATAGRIPMLRNMLDNFAYLIESIGFVPNGNRSYFCTRSQPPFFAPMVELLAEATGDRKILASYLEPLEREYAFWMAGSDQLAADRSALRRVFRCGDFVLNRYWDESAKPRQESYAEDRALADASPRDAAGLYRDIRAACESGWDFSSRWLRDGRSLASIRTTEIAPLDLNCLLYKLETTIAAAHELCGSREAAATFGERAEQRAEAIRSHFFDAAGGFFVDLELATLAPTGTPTLAASYPLFFGIATAEQAARVAGRLQAEFLRPGGWVTSLSNTGQQWDAPNGWPPLQWLAYCGLRDYGFDEQADEGARRWVECNLHVYREQGRLLEKYDVEQTDRVAGGGEYAVQDGFGWTNGVLLALLDRLEIDVD